MTITCPSCAAEYNVPGTLAAGRVVRCAKCATEWTPVPALPSPVMEQATPPMPEPLPQAADPLERLAPRTEPPLLLAGNRLLLLAWAASFLLIVAALALAVLFRAPVMRAWPPSQRVYGVLGLRIAPSPRLQGNVVE